MCDYSLMHFPNRLASEGEELLVHRFPSGSLGLASPADVNAKRREPSCGRARSFWASLKEFFDAPQRCEITAVCVPPGAQLMLEDIPERLCKQYGLEAQEEVRFEQLTQASNVYRDGVVFRNGTKLRLQQLLEGQRVTILALSSSAQQELSAALFTPVGSV